MMKLNKKAYTLSEFILILMLVVILGWMIFSAHSRRVATQQAVQAEQFMRAVRYEQEDRCAMGQKYEVYADHLKTFLKKKQNTKFFSYNLGSGMGLVAKNKFYDYVLQMPSYADGRICCDNCEKLNRKYSPCALLLRRKDFVQVEEECAFYPEKLPNHSAQDAQPAPDVPAPPQTDTPAANEQPEQAVSTDEQNLSGVEQQTGEEQPAPQTQEEAQPQEAPEGETPQEETSAQPTQEGTVPETEDLQAPACPQPGEQGAFYIVPCETYQPGTQGAVMFTWNTQTCQYDTTQNCLVPARWKASKTVTREEKEVYPSDLDKLCPQLLQELGCGAEVKRDKECFEVGSTCYTQCEVTKKEPLQESSMIVLYNVTLGVRSLQCSPSRSVTVEIP